MRKELQFSYLPTDIYIHTYIHIYKEEEEEEESLFKADAVNEEDPEEE